MLKYRKASRNTYPAGERAITSLVLRSINNILIQTSQVTLAQTNQIPQGVFDRKNLKSVLYVP